MTERTLDALQRIEQWFLEGFDRASGDSTGRRIGAELKFPLVTPDGAPAPREALVELWRFLAGRGWTLDRDSLTGDLSGATLPGEKNETVASFETGYCKPEFSLAHVGDLHALDASVGRLLEDLRAWSSESGSCFLAYGIHPDARPGKHLMMKKLRSSFWEHAVPSNRVIPKEDGDDVQLFTVNTASHVHVSVSREEAVRAVNIYNGFAGAQIALMADSPVWRGAADETYLCVAEKLWDWWTPAAGRSGVPPRAFSDTADYIDAVAAYRPIYCKRDGKPVLLDRYDSLAEYLSDPSPKGRTLEGEEVDVEARTEDVDLHNSCYWWTARISRYYTVENRACDQQPVDALLGPAAITLGLISAADAAWEELRAYDWDALRDARENACRDGMDGTVSGAPLRDMAARMLDIAEEGLRGRGLGEEKYLVPLRERVRGGTCPARDAKALWERGGVRALADARRI